MSSGPDAAALDVAVAEVEDFVGTAGWDAPRRMFALVDTAALLDAEPSLAGSVDAAAPLTPIAQDDLVGDDLAGALAGISWPDEVAGCVLALGIMAGGADTDEPSAAAQTGAAETAETAVEGRLVVGVLRDRPVGSCLLRWRSSPQELLRGPGLAPGLLAALHATFED